MDPSTPRRVYNLRSNDRALRVGTQPIRLRKRVTGTDTTESSAQKRQRTQQSCGPEFSSPDAMIPQRCIHFAEHKSVPSLPERLADHVQEEPYGDFGNLPTDAAFCMMTRIPYHHLGTLAMTSHSWMETITAYANSGSLRARWLEDVADAPDVLPEGFGVHNDPFYSMGMLIRRLTFNHTSAARVDVLQTFVRAAYETGATPAGLSRMIHAFVIRPDEDIELKVIDDVVAMYFTVIDDLKDDLNCVLVRPESDRQLVGRENMDIMFSELETRKKTLALFLNFGSTDPAFGLNKYFLGSLMKTFKLLHGALPTALFYLLFAPTTIHNECEVINWHRLSQVSVTSLEDAQELKPLSRALYALLSCRNLKSAMPWTKNTIFNLMEEVTTYPTPWSMNTFVSLQVLEPELVPIGVIARMHRNHEEEAGDMICTMKMLLHRWDMDVHGVMERVMENIKSGLKQPQKRCLFDRCWDWHQKNIDELRARVGRFGDIQAEIESQIEFMPVLMNLL